MTGRWGAAGAVLLVLALASPGAAQGGTPAVQVTVSPATVQFPHPGPTHFTAGAVDHSPLNVSIDARGPGVQWRLSLRALDSDLGGYGKPLQDLLWRRLSENQWRPVSTTELLVAEGSGDAIIPLALRMLLEWTRDEPGSYGTTLVLVVEQTTPGPPGGPAGAAVLTLPVGSQ